MHPGAHEVCGDTLDNDCNGVTDDSVVPSARPVLALSAAGGNASLAWSPVPSALFYDVVTGGVGALRASNGDFGSATTACLGNDVYGTNASDAALPPSGDAFWYLVRGASCGGAGSYDGPAPPQSGSRDAAIAGSAGRCP